jgi:hypothetical protein
MGRKASSSAEAQFLAQSRARRGDRLAARVGAARKNRKYTIHTWRATKRDNVRHDVVDNLPRIIPVLPHELDVIDLYLGALLDQMLDFK